MPSRLFATRQIFSVCLFPPDACLPVLIILSAVLGKPVQPDALRRAILALTEPGSEAGAAAAGVGGGGQAAAKTRRSLVTALS